MTTPTGSATSSTSFVVGSSTAPTISGFSPAIGTSGTAVTISGTNFDSTLLNNRVAFNLTRGWPTSGGGTSITTALPASAGSGHISVMTPNGTAVSAGDFFVPPSPYTPADVVTSTRMAVGDTLGAAVGTSNKIALVVFDGSANQRVSLKAVPGPIGAVTIYHPDLSVAAQSAIGVLTVLLEPPVLSRTGTYSIVVDPTGTATGTTNLMLYNVPADFTGTITAGDASATGVQISTSVPGQNGRLTFSASANDRVAVAVSSGPGGTVSIRKPDDSTHASGTIGIFASFIDTTVLPVAGTYSLFADYTGINTGNVTLTLYAVPADFSDSVTPSQAGAPKAVALTVPGQNGTVAFHRHRHSAHQRQGVLVLAFGNGLSSQTGWLIPGLGAQRDCRQLHGHPGARLVRDVHLESGSLQRRDGHDDADGLRRTRGHARHGDGGRKRRGRVAWHAEAERDTDGQRDGESNRHCPDDEQHHQDRRHQGHHHRPAAQTRRQRTGHGQLECVQLQHGLEDASGSGHLHHRGEPERNGHGKHQRPGHESINSTSDTEIPCVTGGVLLSFRSRCCSASFRRRRLEPGRARQGARSVSGAQPGQSATELPDGRWRLLGGERTPSSATVWDPHTDTRQPLAALQVPRTWHTATVMPDGSVFVAGGRDPQGQLIDVPEWMDPTTGRFSVIDGAIMTGRAGHTATLLTDGRVLLAGGESNGGIGAELWYGEQNVSVPLSSPSGVNRRGHRAELLPDGRVQLAGGVDETGQSVPSIAVFDPVTDLVTAANALQTSPGELALMASLPADGAVDVKIDRRIALRFGQPVDPATVNAGTIAVEATGSTLPASVVVAEGGRLVFVTPAQPLPFGATVAIRIDALRTPSGQPLNRARITFTTEPAPVNEKAGPDDPDVWTPTRPDSGQPLESPWRKLPPLAAPKGVTALAGQALLLNGTPLAGVTVEIDGHSAQTDRTGRFLLTLGVIAGGWHELVIDGSSANHGRRRFGIFEYGLSIVAKRTNVLPFTIWMPVLDTANAVHIQSPTRQETVITTPHIPGLELHLPAGTVITDEDGRIVREVSITPIPVDRPPFPLPNGVQVPIYFTIQPGGAYVDVIGSTHGKSARRSDDDIHRGATYGSANGAFLVYPNYTKQPVNQRIPFWHYDPEHNGWHVYGHGRVTPDGQQVRPYPGVVLYEFTGAMIGVERDPPGDLPPGPDGGDPVHLATGTFVMEKVDLVLHDVIPIGLKRTYRTNDEAVRPFGVGGQHPYDMWFDNQGLWFESDLILPNGTRIHYAPISTGPGTKDVILEHTSTPTQFYGSRVVYNGSGWDLTLKDGTTYVFGVEAPLQKIRDRFGNTVTITRTGGPNGNIAKITSPHGRYLEFTYDTSDRITQAKDNLGRTVNYTYDTAGRVATASDVMGGVTEYTYDGAHRMLTIEDPRNIVYLENEYDTAGRVIRQTQADGGEYEFEYTVNGAGETQTNLTNPRGFVQRLIFDTAGYLSSDTHAFGQSIKQETTYSRLSGSRLPETITDELNRVTAFEYDTKGNPTKVTRLDGTADEQPTALTYEPTYNQLATLTDALNHTTTLTYGDKGRLAAVTDALNHSRTFTSNAAGQMLSTTSAVNATTSFGYDVGDLVQVVSPLGHTASSFVDAVGRVTQVTDARGGITRVAYNNQDQITAITDPLGGQTTFTYDGNGNLLTLTDARSKTTTWTYNSMDRVETRTDPLDRTESFEYDLNGNLAKWTDRKGQVTVIEYDALDRPTMVGFGAAGTPATYASTTTDEGHGVARHERIEVEETTRNEIEIHAE